jgi:hypothetical protein
MYTATWRMGARSVFKHTFHADSLDHARTIAAAMAANWPGPDRLQDGTVYPAGGAA